MFFLKEHQKLEKRPKAGTHRTPSRSLRAFPTFAALDDIEFLIGRSGECLSQKMKGQMGDL